MNIKNLIRFLQFVFLNCIINYTYLYSIGFYLSKYYELYFYKLKTKNIV